MNKKHEEYRLYTATVEVLVAIPGNCPEQFLNREVRRRVREVMEEHYDQFEITEVVERK